MNTVKNRTGPISTTPYCFLLHRGRQSRINLGLRQRRDGLITYLLFCLLGRHFVDIDVAVGGTREQDIAVRRPRQGGDPRQLGNVLAGLGDAVDDALGLEVPDLNAVVGGGTEPVVLGGERQGVDGGASGQRVQVLALIDVPEHGSSVLATRGDEGTIRGDGQSVDDSVVADKVGSQLAVGQVPHLDDSVPTSRHDQGLLSGGRETDARDPVVVLVLLDGVLALTKGVPELDGLITTGRDDLSVIGGETDGEDITLVGEERSDRLSLVQVPQSQGLVPRSRQGVSTIGRKDNIGNRAVVTGQGLTGISVVLALGGELPDNDLLVTRRSDDGVGVSETGSDSGDAVAVSLQVSSVDELNHCLDSTNLEGWWKFQWVGIKLEPEQANMINRFRSGKKPEKNPLGNVHD